ncbi:hypothetical protein GGD83_003890 [Rhodoblastus sphagnicola]|nr:hypothetical protein [Rhodoblastus sphagnicola]MBB4200063.1 hypothetical protein [Rhodoblastus sphagnicola]
MRDGFLDVLGEDIGFVGDAESIENGFRLPPFEVAEIDDEG